MDDFFFPNRSCFFLFSFVFTKTNKQNHLTVAGFELSLELFFLEDKNYATLKGYMPVSLLGRRYGTFQDVPVVKSSCLHKAAVRHRPDAK